MTEVSNAEAIGRFVGQSVVAAMLVLGLVKCGSISRRPATNTKCIIALMLVLIAWLQSALLSLFFGGADGSKIVIMASGLITLGSMIAATVFAILGLVEYSRARGQY